MSAEQAGKPRCRAGRRFWMPGRTVLGARPARAIRPPPGRSWSRSQPVGTPFGPGSGPRLFLTPSATRCPSSPSMSATSPAHRRHGWSRPVRDLAHAGPRGRRTPGNAPSHGRSCQPISNDYLSPITRQYILRDLPFAIFPWRQSYDRGHALEDAMVHGGKLTELGSTFAQLLVPNARARSPRWFSLPCWSRMGGGS